MKRIIIASVLSFCFYQLSAQQIANSNFYNYNMYLVNPALAGSTGQIEGTLSHRLQWLGIEGAPKANHLGLHAPIGSSFGAGLKMHYSRTDLLRKVNGALSFAYRLKIGDNQQLNFGASLGMIQNSLLVSSARVFDELDEIVASGNQSAITATADLGLVYQFKKLQLGASVHQLPETGLGYEIASSKRFLELNRQYNFFITSRFELTDAMALTPLVLGRYDENGAAQADLLADLEWRKRLKIGLGYRTNTGLITQFGLRITEHILAAYSYEVPVAGVARYTGGSHEFMIGISLSKSDKEEELPEIVEEEPAEVIEEPEKVLEEIAEEIPVIEEVAIEPVKEDTNQPKEPSVLEIPLRTEEVITEQKPEPTIAYAFMDEVLLFDFESAELDVQSKATLDEVATELNSTPGLNLIIAGHTCNMGSPATNRQVSLRRAESAARYLSQKGVDIERLKLEGRADRENVSTNDTIENRRKNRRVSFEIWEK